MTLSHSFLLFAGAGLAISGLRTLASGTFVGGADGESRTYAGEDAMLWGGVHLALGGGLLAILFFAPEAIPFILSLI
jgi:hypothetical protein